MALDLATDMPYKRSFLACATRSDPGSQLSPSSLSFPDNLYLCNLTSVLWLQLSRSGSNSRVSYFGNYDDHALFWKFWIHAYWDDRFHKINLLTFSFVHHEGLFSFEGSLRLTWDACLAPISVLSHHVLILVFFWFSSYLFHSNAWFRSSLVFLPTTLRVTRFALNPKI